MAKKTSSVFRRIRDRALRLWKREGTPKNLFILAGGLFLLSGIISALMTIPGSLFYDRGLQERIVPSAITAAPRHPLTGALLSAPLTALPQVFGIMIENSADAWPLSGLDQAFLVIEAPVEGNIPRFIAFFSDDQSVAKIGPVRSARPYYLDWNAEFQGIYGHVGGSPEALDDIAMSGTLDLNQFFQSEYYYRDELTRYAPHNVYTNTSLLKSAISEIDEKYAADSPSYDAWIFTDGASESSAADTTHIEWGSGYDIDWTYDPATNVYRRSQGGNTYVANNVVVIATNIGTIPGDDKGRRTVRTIGEGPMMLLQNGTQNNVPWTWKKTSASSRMRFYDDTGKEVTMNAGKTWIEVVEDLGQVSMPFATVSAE
ncbi:MAG: DUF3048 domain-containing protein [Patescibacteria group bacterium]